MGKAEYLAKGEIPVLSSPHSPGRSRTPAACTKISTVPAGRWKTAIQGTAARSVRRSHQHPGGALESTAAVLLLVCLCAHRNPASVGAWGDRAGPSAMRHHSPETLENRRSDPHHGAQCLDRLLRSLSLCKPLPSGAGPSAANSLALLARAIGLFRGARTESGVRGSLGLRSQNASNHLHLSTATSINYSICPVDV